jgi:hypothetical protein
MDVHIGRPNHQIGMVSASTRKSDRVCSHHWMNESTSAGSRQVRLPQPRNPPYQFPWRLDGRQESFFKKIFGPIRSKRTFVRSYSVGGGRVEVKRDSPVLKSRREKPEIRVQGSEAKPSRDYFLKKVRVGAR